MRHGIAGNTLGRHTAHRKATVRDIAKATLVQERICTTKAKAKVARRLVDKLITLGKKGTLADKRRAFSILCDHKLVSNLFKDTAGRFKNRVGGYTRIIPLGTRRGDCAQLAFLELTEKAEVIITKPKTTASAKKEKIAPITEDKVDKVTEAPVEVIKDVVKEPTQKRDDVKKKHTPKEEKKKSGKKFGLGNIFKRKSQ